MTQQQGFVRLIWYLVWVFFWTVVIRGMLSWGVRLMGRAWPDTMDALSEFERYGWWISLVTAALLASAF